MRSIRLESFKYPRQPRYFFPAEVIEDTGQQLVLYTPTGSPIYVGKENTTVPSTSHALAFLWPNRYYNATLFWKPDWTFKGYYVNLALPPQWDGELCEYIDLELDVGLYNGVVEIYDEDEYEESKIRYNYPPELIAQIERSTQEVVERMEKRLYPFDGSFENWRPAAA